MRSGILAVAASCSACGAVNNTPGDAASSDAPAAKTYHGAIAQTSPVNFGAAPGCTYTVTLRQIDVQIGILPSGQVTTGQVQSLYDEALVSTCTTPVANPTISNFTFASAMASSTGQTLTFQEKAGDKPGASLVIGLSASGTTYQAQLTFHRTDLGPPLDWTVVATTPLAPQ